MSLSFKIGPSPLSIWMTGALDAQKRKTIPDGPWNLHRLTTCPGGQYIEPADMDAPLA
jgi:hypothetical protein